MAGKSLIPFIGSSSNSTYNLDGEPTLANQLIPVEHYKMEGVNALWAQPLVTVSGSPANLEHFGEYPGRSTSAERYVGTLFTKAGDEVLHKYTTSTTTPSTPKEDRFRIQGVRTPGGGYGKGLLRPLTVSKKEGAAESRIPPPIKVKRHLTPPPIVRAAGQYQGDEVKSPEPSVYKLASQVRELRKENIELRACNTELGVELAELRNNVDTLSRGLCAKIKHAFVEMGKENKYYAN
ncbi:hypothetical protein OsI_18644 [Oryza sativa Indica Group]|uniref:Uncharacterized protein n=1 Tax=Oryza sativa subsp. indica TaxID=39946 RepID=A2Y0W8_ORYSI|nr:hypothetical protein OsI_18644 [Oryza sativa Indica Group]